MRQNTAKNEPSSNHCQLGDLIEKCSFQVRAAQKQNSNQMHRLSTLLHSATKWRQDISVSESVVLFVCCCVLLLNGKHSKRIIVVREADLSELIKGLTLANCSFVDFRR